MTFARGLAAAAAALILLSGCTSPDNNTAAGTATHSTPPTSATPTARESATPTQAPSKHVTPTPAPAESTATAAAADVTVPVVVKDGKVTPNGDNVRVKDGQSVQISLDSDTAESIHVHGYDKTVEVQPGETDQVTFVADQKGVFEVETHETEKLVVKLIVS